MDRYRHQSENKTRNACHRVSAHPPRGRWRMDLDNADGRNTKTQEEVRRVSRDGERMVSKTAGGEIHGSAPTAVELLERCEMRDVGVPRAITKQIKIAKKRASERESRLNQSSLSGSVPAPPLLSLLICPASGSPNLST